MVPEPAARAACARTPTTYRKNLAAAENDRLQAQDSYDAFRRQLRDDGRKTTKAESARSARLRKQAGRDGAARSPSRARRHETALIALYKRMGHVLRDLAEDDPPARDPRDRRRAVLQRHDPHRRAARRSSTTCASTPRTSRASSSRSATCAVPARRSSPRSCSGACSRSARSSSRRSEYAGVAQGTRIGQSGLEQHLRQVPARHRRLPARRRRRVRQPRRPAHGVGHGAQAGPAAEADARLRTCSRRATRRWRRRSQPRTTAPAPAPTWRWTRATARSWRWARSPASTRRCSRARSPRSIWKAPDVAGHRRAAAQPRDRLGVSDRLDVQADHGAGGARVRA